MQFRAASRAEEPFLMGRRFLQIRLETGMAVDRRRLGNGDRVSSCFGAALRAGGSGILALNIASCACDMPARTQRVAEPAIPGSTSDGASQPPLQRRSVTQQTPPKELHRNDVQRNATTGHLPDTTRISTVPRPRTPERKSTPPPPDTEKDQLYREFLEWQRRPRDGQ
jgi:hypothetical protein